MEEKERYVIRYDLDYNQCLIDTEENQGVGDYIKIVKLLNQQDKRIKELEKQLEESEKQIKDARETANMTVDSWCKNRRKYEAQIAEMQNKSFILYSMLYETLEKQGCDNVASQIDQMTGWTYDKEADWLKGNRNYDQLKQQLAEKDAERELDNSFWKQECDSLQKTLVEKDKEIEKLNACVDFYKSYFVSFQEKVIDELERVKEKILPEISSYVKKEFVVKEFDNQIKQLTHQHEDKGE